MPRIGSYWNFWSLNINMNKLLYVQFVVKAEEYKNAIFLKTILNNFWLICSDLDDTEIYLSNLYV